MNIVETYTFHPNYKDIAVGDEVQIVDVDKDTNDYLDDEECTIESHKLYPVDYIESCNGCPGCPHRGIFIYIKGNDNKQYAMCQIVLADEQGRRYK